MKHLRIALEGESGMSNLDDQITGELSAHIEGLAAITDGMPDLDDSPSSISMESFLRFKPGSCEELTKFRVSMEDMSIGVIGALIAAIAAVVALIIKAVKYFTGGSSSGGGGGGGAIAAVSDKREHIKEATKDESAIAADVDKMLRQHPVSMPSGERKEAAVRTILNVLENSPHLVEKMNHMAETYADVLSVHARDNVFLIAIREFNGVRAGYQRAWREASDNYDQVINLLLIDVNPDNPSSIKSYQKAIENAQERPVDVQFKGPKGDQIGVYDLAHYIREASQAARSVQKVETDMQIVEANVASYFASDDVDKTLKMASESMDYVRLLANELNESEGLLKAIQRDRQHLEAKESLSGADEATILLKEGNRILSDAISNYAKHIRGMVSIANEVVAYAERLNKTHAATNAMTKALVEEILHHAKDMPEEQRAAMREKLATLDVVRLASK